MTESTDASPLARFHPLVASWFGHRYGEPTPVQAAAWPVIAAGRHVLASAPTGSGKTLTAFLDALSRFATGSLPATGLSVLYVSPLKALNEDVRVNLVGPLRELSSWFASNGEAFPKVRVSSRSGDTPQSERRSMAASPPAILCTTPESLAILLASKSGIAALSTVRLLILDEVHAVLGTKRGSALACSVGRLALLAGEFQRVALSATVRPFEAAARFVGGSRLARADDGTAAFEPRAVSIVAPPSAKRYEFSVAWPVATTGVRPMSAGPDDRETGEPAGRYDAIVGDLAVRIAAERSTIVFADSRRRAERLASMINAAAGEGTAWAHHGSLSRDVRRAVEARLREGRLRCVVATGTLELGIDIGSVDLVAMAGAPSRADQALQRAGRAGHGVGLTSRALVYPFHGLDLLAAAAAVGAAIDGDVDPVRPPRSPLDVLVQALLSMVLFDERPVDELYDEVRSFEPFERLGREEFDSVVGLLRGRYSGTRVKDLAPRVYFDPERRTIKAREGAAMLLYSAGGSIPDRGYYSMRLAGDGTRIGELDEEFVFERRVGNSFRFGAQSWRIVSIGDEAVEVAPLDREADFMPFWKAEKTPRGTSIASRMLEACSAFSADPSGFSTDLVSKRGFSPDAADALSAFLSAQARAQGGVPLPSGRSVPVEVFRDPTRRGDARAVAVHTLRGSAVNEPLGLALAAAIGDRLGMRVERLSDDDSIMLLLPLTDDDSAKAAVLEAFAELASPAAFGARIRGALAGSGTFGAAFRENAGRALLLPRSGFGKRTPLWVTRLRAKRLYEKTGGYEDFPIVVETWKTVLEGRFDLATATALFAGIADGSVSLSFFNPPVPSPFARQAGWAETNRFLYEGDELPGAGNIRPVDNGTTAGGYGGSAGDRAIENAMTHATARPAIPQDLALELGRKLRRELPGWAPESPLALADWVDERVLVPADEWEALLAACPEELRAVAADLPGIASARLPGARTDVVVNKSRLQGLAAGIEADPARMMAEWLRSTGPTPLGRLSLIFGLPDEAAVSSALERAASVVPGDLGTMGGERGVAGACDRDVLESLLRRTRKAARPTIRSLPARDLPAFVATVQGLRDRRAAPPGQGMRAGHDAVDASDSAGIAATRRALAALSGFPAAASLWETELLPARVAGYRPEYLDQILGSGEFIWFGAGQQTLAFVARGDYEAFARGAASALLRPGEPPLDAWAIKDRSGLSIAEFEDAVWREAWDGAISSDSFEAVRRAATEGFRRVAYSGQAPRDDARPGYPGVSGPEGQRSQGHGRVPLAIRGRWKAGAPVAGNWFSLALDDGTGREGASRDEADALELSMGAVRAMVRRYGILCRALLERELPQAGWAASFQALRRLELSGELVSGRFFDGIDGLQFIGREALAVYVGGGFGGLLWSANACDPASPAGLSVGGLPDRVPSRLPVNRISMRGGDPVCVSRRSWRDLELALAPDDQDLAPALGFIVEARRRPVSPEQRIVVSTVNGEPATRSPYTGALAALGFDADRDSMTLW